MSSVDADPASVLHEPAGGDATAAEESTSDSDDADPEPSTEDTEPDTAESDVDDLDTDEPDGESRDSGEPSRLAGRDPLWAKALVAFGTVLVLVAGTAITASRVLAHRYTSSITQESLINDSARVPEPAQRRRTSVRGPLNYLLIGSDARVDNPGNGQRSDTIIVVHIPAGLNRAYLLSIPRDLRVQIPAFPEADFRGGRERVNNAFNRGGGGAAGVRLLSETLSQLLGIRFDGAAIIDFGGFEKAVEQLGGVYMCIDERIESRHVGVDENGNFLAPYTGVDNDRRNPRSTPIVYEAGCQHFKAWQALDLVRQRKSLTDGDFGRQRNQQRFLRALFEQARAQDLTSNPIALDRFLRAIGESLTIDTNGIPLDELMFAMRDMRPGNLLGVTLPSVPETIAGTAYVVQTAEADGLFTALQGDTLDTWAALNPAWINRL